LQTRIERENKTVRDMIELYCRKHHSSRQLCPECLDLLEYAHERLQKCPYQNGKTTCSQCPVHCYNLQKRNKIKIVMRSSGPSMLFYHPVAAIQYLFDKRRREPIIFMNKKQN
jgi:hypothetical protein